MSEQTSPEVMEALRQAALQQEEASRQLAGQIARLAEEGK
ncbi:hypothetical protein SAMN04487980_10583 [Streptomyces sp. cf124]|nr:hypothetical protein SAMN04487980_10583 [Streptomyces sp. cf124]